MVMYLFAKRKAIEVTYFETGLSRKPVAACYDVIRSLVVDFMHKIASNTKLGGQGRIVCLDETHITRKKRSRGGFSGRTTGSHQTVPPSGCELDGPHHGRKTTGKVFVANKEADTFKEVIGKHVHVGSTVWTDGHSCYNWLDSAGYPRQGRSRMCSAQ